MSEHSSNDTISSHQPVKRTFNILFVILPLAVVALGVLGWSAFWYQKVGQVEARLDELIRREAEAGKQWTCNDRKIGGYPFRVEISCSSAALAIKDTDLKIGIGAMHFVVQAYDPALMIVEAESPMSVTNNSGETWTVKWDLARSSIRLDLSNVKDLPERSAMEIKSISVLAPKSQKATTTIESIDIQGRRNPEKFATERAYDLAFTMTNLNDQTLNELSKTNDPLTVSYDMMMTHSVEPSNKPVNDQLEAWRSQGGLINLRQFTVSRGPFTMVMSGELGFDVQHRPDFRLDLKVKGVEDVLKATGQRADMLALLGGKRAATGEMAFNLRTQGGQAFIGPMPLGKLPPLY